MIFGTGPFAECARFLFAEEDVRVLAGVRVSAPCRMFVELARYLNLVELVVLGDWLVQHRHTNVPALRHYCRRSTEQCADRAARAAAYVRSGSESPRESRLRLLLALAGLPSITTNLVVVVGSSEFRLDLAFTAVKVAVEYDGRHHDDPEQREADARRRQLLEAQGWVFVVVAKDQLYADPGGVIAQVVAALRARGMRIPPLRDDWRSHFGR